MAVELIVPEVGESITEVQIGKWLKNQGDAVKKDEPVVEIETDKITLELPAPADGTISQVDKNQGDEASVGDVIGYMEQGSDAGGGSGGDSNQGQSSSGDQPTPTAPEISAASEADGKASSSQGAAPTQSAERDKSRPDDKPPQGGSLGDPSKVMPAAQRLLDENSLKAEQVQATGPGGRLLKEDVQQHLDSSAGNGQKASASSGQSESAPSRREPSPDQAAASSTPPPTAAGSPAAVESAVAGSPDRAEETVPMTPMRKSIAQRLVSAQQTGALLTTFNEVNMAEVMAVRSRYKDQFLEKYGVKLGFMSFFVKAAVDALKEFPAVNAEVRDTDIVYKNYYDIGIAVGTGKGLVVPVLRNAERLSFAEIESTIGDFGKRAQAGKLQLSELQGGTFTITNGGVFGSLLSTPIVNPPQSAVLGMHSIQKRPIVNEKGDIVAAPMMYTALTYDHRLVDGREAVTFLRRIKETVEDPNRLLMEV